MKIIHRETDELVAEGERGWAITPFEGNLYISGKALRTDGCKSNYAPGLCYYKFLYVWLNSHRSDGRVAKLLGWGLAAKSAVSLIWFRVAVSQNHPDLLVIEQETRCCRTHGVVSANDTVA